MTGPLLVLVHGAWHGAWCFALVQEELAALGLRSVAVDLPGNGVHARIPDSYWADPFDPARFATEPSRSKDVTLATQVGAVVAIVERLHQQGENEIVVVGHSMGGHVITGAGEQIPERIARLVYLAALMPASGVPVAAYVPSDESRGERVTALFRADPGDVGALRINPGAAADRPAIIEAFAATVPAERHSAILNLLSTDLPLQVPTQATDTTADRWGSIPRTYIRCTRDQAIMLPLQDRFIAEADAFTPANPTSVATMDTCHSPFLANPAGLAQILAATVA